MQKRRNVSDDDLDAMFGIPDEPISNDEIAEKIDGLSYQLDYLKGEFKVVGFGLGAIGFGLLYLIFR
jgi:hypothetical protein